MRQLGELLISQLSDPEQRASGFDFIISIAQQLPSDKQQHFIVALGKELDYTIAPTAALPAAYAELKEQFNKQPAPHNIAWETILKDTLFHQAPNFWHANIGQSRSNNTKDIAAVLDTDMNNYLYLGPKIGGVNDPGPHGGRYLCCYLDNDAKLQTITLLCKQPHKNQVINKREIIAELMASIIMNELVDDIAASVFLTKCTAAVPEQHLDPTAANYYLASVFFNGWQSMHQVANQAATNTPTVTPRVNKFLGMSLNGGIFSGQLIHWGNPNFQPGLKKLYDSKQIDLQSLAAGLCASLLIGNEQLHSENVGACMVDEVYHVKVIDFGGAFRRTFQGSSEIKNGAFSPLVDIYNYRDKKLYSSYILAYPEEIRCTKEFIMGLDEIAAYPFAKLAAAIDKAVDSAITAYGEQNFAAYFAKELNTQDTALQDATSVATASKNFLKTTLYLRQLSLTALSITSKLKYNQLHQNKADIYDSDILATEYPNELLSKNQTPQQALVIFQQSICQEMNTLAKSLNKQDTNFQTTNQDLLLEFNMLRSLIKSDNRNTPPPPAKLHNLIYDRAMAVSNKLNEAIRLANDYTARPAIK